MLKVSEAAQVSEELTSALEHMYINEKVPLSAKGLPDLAIQGQIPQIKHCWEHSVA